MKSVDLEKVIARMDKTFSVPFPADLQDPKRSQLRALLEVAYQLALLNENGISVHN